jgi:hypothetical protein
LLSSNKWYLTFNLYNTYLLARFFLRFFFTAPHLHNWKSSPISITVFTCCFRIFAITDSQPTEQTDCKLSSSQKAATCCKCGDLYSCWTVGDRLFSLIFWYHSMKTTFLIRSLNYYSLQLAYLPNKLCKLQNLATVFSFADLSRCLWRLICST